VGDDEMLHDLFYESFHDYTPSWVYDIKIHIQSAQQNFAQEHMSVHVSGVTAVKNSPE
jgi:hypothetical protein